jgi:hypothetical protein
MPNFFLRPKRRDTSLKPYFNEVYKSYNVFTMKRVFINKAAPPNVNKPKEATNLNQDVS